ncbi:MAG TPA: diguanylate cyclase [Bacillota bacterium]|nr:diguanylate cyclase [Bacillota bacterium]
MEDNKSYITKSLLLWGILLVISIFLGYSIYNAFSGRIYANVFKSMNNNLRFAESSYGVFMNQMKMGMLQASVEKNIKEMITEKDSAALEDLLKKWGEHRDYVDEWYVVGEDGNIISSAGKGKDLLIKASGKTKIQEIVGEALSSGTVITGTELIPIGSRGEFTLVQYVIVPVMENDRGVIGGIVTLMNLDGDDNITGKIMSDTGMHSIISAKDRIIASSLESELYRLNKGSSLPEDIRKEVLEKDTPFVKRLEIFRGSREDKDSYFGAFRAIKDIEGSIIGVQGIIHNDPLAETTLGQIRDFTVIAVILLAAVFSIIIWSYINAQKVLLKEKQFSNRLSSIKRFSDLVRQASNEDEVYEILFDVLKKKSGITQVVVAKKEYNDKCLTLYKAMDMEKIQSIKNTMTVEENCWAVKSGKEFINNGNNNDFDCKDFYSESASYICLPIILGGIVSGVIQIQSDMKNYFNDDLIAEIKVYIDNITPVISNIRLLESLNNMASIDTLTKAYNRRYLEKYLEEQIKISKENNLHLSIIMIDIDFFKIFNDTYGHDAGDYVLMYFADTLKFNVREADVVSRYGGEEFIVVLPRTNHRGAYRVAEKLRKKVEEMSLTAISNENPPKITCSLGISVYPLHGNNIDMLIHSADKALYKAKNSGRNRTCISGDDNEREGIQERHDDINNTI